jgi:hypothetical protein
MSLLGAVYAPFIPRGAQSAVDIDNEEPIQRRDHTALAAIDERQRR